MPSCSANDAQNVDALPPTAGGAMMAAATDAATDAKVPAPQGPGCWRERCRNEQMGGAPCPPGICQRDGRGNPTSWHPRPPCPDHDRPYGLDAKAALPPDAEKRQKAVAEKLLPTVHAYVDCLQGLADAGELTADERAHVDGLRAWLEKLRAEQATPGK